MKRGSKGHTLIFSIQMPEHFGSNLLIGGGGGAGRGAGRGRGEGGALNLVWCNSNLVSGISVGLAFCVLPE